MLLLLILADDFTGALDTGVQFAACGIPTRVVVGEQVDFAANDAAVLVVDTDDAPSARCRGLCRHRKTDPGGDECGRFQHL